MVRSHDRRAGAAGAWLIAACLLPAAAPAQTADVKITPAEPPHIAHKVEQLDETEAALTRREAERELRKIRARYFGTMRNVEVRQIGIRKMREFTDPLYFPAMLEILRKEKDDVRTALLDHFADQGTDEGDATLAWAAVFNEDKWFRDQARARLAQRVAQVGEPSWRIKTVVAQGLKSKDDDEVAQAAQTIEAIKLFEAIPQLISAQLGGGGTGASTGGRQGGDRALAYILVGTQQAFVSDLTPVVGENAVAFDPELSVVTDGTVLRVIDAVVVTYRTEVHNSLVRMTSREWGRSTSEFGYDVPRWRRWYAEEFVPHLEAKVGANRRPEAPGDDGPG